jgi:hypothetical protein
MVSAIDWTLTSGIRLCGWPWHNLASTFEIIFWMSSSVETASSDDVDVSLSRFDEWQTSELEG